MIQGAERGYDGLTQIFEKVISVNRNVGEGRFPKKLKARGGTHHAHQVRHFTWTTTSRRPQLRAPPAALGVFQNPSPKLPEKRTKMVRGEEEPAEEFAAQARARWHAAWSPCALGHCRFTSRAL